MPRHVSRYLPCEHCGVTYRQNYAARRFCSILYLTEHGFSVNPTDEYDPRRQEIPCGVQEAT